MTPESVLYCGERGNMMLRILGVFGLLVVVGCDNKDDDTGTSSNPANAPAQWWPMQDGLEWQFDDGQDFSAEIQASLHDGGWTLDFRMDSDGDYTQAEFNGWTTAQVLYIDQIRFDGGDGFKIWNADAAFPILGTSLTEGLEFEEDFTNISEGWIELHGRLTGLADIGTPSDDSLMTVEYTIDGRKLTLTLVKGIGPVMAVYKGEGELVAIEGE